MNVFLSLPGLFRAAQSGLKPCVSAFKVEQYNIYIAISTSFCQFGRRRFVICISFSGNVVGWLPISWLWL